MTSVAFCASPEKSCGVQIIIRRSLTNIPSSLKLFLLPLIEFYFSESHLCHIVTNCLCCTHASTQSHIHTYRYICVYAQRTDHIQDSVYTFTNTKGFVRRAYMYTYTIAHRCSDADKTQAFHTYVSCLILHNWSFCTGTCQNTRHILSCLNSIIAEF